MRKWLLLCLWATTTPLVSLTAHCQMPCGIYHDDIVFDNIDQYIETMYKGITVMNDSKFATPQEHNEFIRWVCTKEELSNQMAAQILTYFLQQKIKPGESDTPKKLERAHALLFLLVQIKQTVSIDILKRFQDEWNSFKTMFHKEGYECELEKIKQKRWQEAYEQAQHREKTQAPADSEPTATTPQKVSTTASPSDKK